MEKNIVKESQILIKVGLDENNVPETIHWDASEGVDVPQECKALMLSVWDENAKEALKIDLWNKEMKTDEMKMFTLQTLHTMADTFERATGEKEMAKDLRYFCDHFADLMGMRGPGGG